MNIRGHELVHNERIPLHVLTYLNERYEAMERRLEERFPNFDISCDVSSQSESFYILVQEEYIPGQFCDSIELSIRNHGNFAGSVYDKDFLLSRYDNWAELRADVIVEIDTWAKAL